MPNAIIEQFGISGFMTCPFCKRKAYQIGILVMHHGDNRTAEGEGYAHVLHPQEPTEKERVLSKKGKSDKSFGFIPVLQFYCPDCGEVGVEFRLLHSLPVEISEEAKEIFAKRLQDREDKSALTIIMYNFP